jgi:hypothetical protein
MQPEASGVSSAIVENVDWPKANMTVTDAKKAIDGRYD